MLIVPWVRAGGADKGILQLANYSRSRGRQEAVVTTLPHDSPWADRLPEGVCLVELGRTAEYAGRDAIPIVAPASVGGLGDFVDAQTAFLVADARDGAEFVARVEQALSDPQQRRLRAAAAFERVTAQFGRAVFLQRMDALFGASGVESGTAAH